ncbi:hypothetical protein M406DRAFT_265985, partial [Cryphonectria parasitica EP155]
EFRSSLDDTLIIAIIGDYDLTTHFDEARGILEDLAQNATAEEGLGFNASGIGSDDQELGRCADDLAGLEWPSDTTTNSASVSGSNRSPADIDISLQTECSDALSESFAALELPQDVNVSALDEDGKVAELKTMFADLSDMDLRMTLKKFKGDFTKACEELLNIQYLEEQGLRPKGIEGAFRLDGLVGYKGKSLHTGRSDAPKDKGKNRLNVNYSLTPPNLSEEDVTIGTSTTSAYKSQRLRGSSLPRVSTIPNAATKVTYSAPDSPALSPTDWQTSFQAAQQAYRRGASNKHFRPVAGVLAERAREHIRVARAADSQKYLALVDENSSAQHIDLHGVPVADGVRIALERTQLWWSSLGENRVKAAREEGFTVVTGLGKHSAGGVSRLRQEVGAALKREGWRVRLETGQFVVTGKT